MRAKKGIHLSGFQISGMIVRKCTFKKKITCANISEQRVVMERFLSQEDLAMEKLS